MIKRPNPEDFAHLPDDDGVECTLSDEIYGKGKYIRSTRQRAMLDEMERLNADNPGYQDLKKAFKTFTENMQKTRDRAKKRRQMR